MNGPLHSDLLALLSALPGVPGLAGALQRLRRPPPAAPLYRSEGFGEDLEAFDACYRPGARTIMRRHPARAEERKQ